MNKDEGAYRLHHIYDHLITPSTPASTSKNTNRSNTSRNTNRSKKAVIGDSSAISAQSDESESVSLKRH